MLNLFPSCRSGCGDATKVVNLDMMDEHHIKAARKELESASYGDGHRPRGPTNMCSASEFQGLGGLMELDDFARALHSEEEALEQAERLLEQDFTAGKKEKGQARVPQSFKIVGKSEKIDGVYHLVADNIVHGCPTWWKAPPHPMVIYSNDKAKWCVTMPSGVLANRAFMKVNDSHQGRYPHQMPWGVTTNGIWRSLKAVFVLEQGASKGTLLEQQGMNDNDAPTVQAISSSTVVEYQVENTPIMVLQPDPPAVFKLRDLLTEMDEATPASASKPRAKDAVGNASQRHGTQVSSISKEPAAHVEASTDLLGFESSQPSTSQDKSSSSQAPVETLWPPAAAEPSVPSKEPAASAKSMEPVASPDQVQKVARALAGASSTTVCVDSKAEPPLYLAIDDCCGPSSSSTDAVVPPQVEISSLLIDTAVCSELVYDTIKKPAEETSGKHVEGSATQTPCSSQRGLESDSGQGSADVSPKEEICGE